MEPIKMILLHQGRADVWANGAENQSVHLTYDISAHLGAWPDAAPSVAFERADGSKYPHAWELDGAILHIPLLLADTEVPGTCKCMITLTQGDGRSNTAIFYGVVTRGIDSLGEEPEEPMLGVIEQVNQAAADAHTAKVGAESAQEEAKESADLASDYKGAAESSAYIAELYRNDSQEYSVVALNAKIDAEHAKDDALASKESAAISEENAANDANEAVNAMNVAAEHAQSAGESAKEAQEYAAEAKAAAADINSDFFVIKYDGTAFDKTYREIESAALSGKMPVVVDSRMGDYYLYGTLDSYNRRYFDRFAYDFDGKFFNYRLRLDPDDKVSNQSRGVVKTPTENKLKFTGAVSGEYDGSAPLTIDIPSGGGNDEIIIIHTANGTTDKTYSEINAAITAGKSAIMIDTIMGKIFQYTHASTQGYVFSNIYQDNEKRLLGFSYILRPDNTVLPQATVPVTTPNPQKLKFQGAVEAEYDGSEVVIVNIPDHGKDGEDGFSPTVNVSDITGGHRLTITDVNGTKTVDVMNGKDGTCGGSGLPEHTAADAGNILYIAPDGNAAWLKVGEGLKIENGTLMLDGASGKTVSFTENADGSVTVDGVVFEEHADGTVLLKNATFTAQADGSVLIQ